MKISIHNLRNSQPEFPYDIKIDRTSPYGNPFRMFTEAQRNVVCAQYKVFLQDKKEPRLYLKKLISLYKEHGQLRLFCWCAPKRCHGEAIVKKLEGLNEKKRV